MIKTHIYRIPRTKSRPNRRPLRRLVKDIKLLGGKFKNPIWRPSDLLWDSDINPEGGAIQLKFKMIPNLDVFFMTGIFVIDENSDGGDPFLVPIQGGVSYKFAKLRDLRSPSSMG
jgi:hypothetical protein